MVQELLENKKVDGFVTLVSVIVLGAIGVLVVTTNLSVNTDTTIILSVYEESKQAKALADTCAEVALENLKDDVNYAGNETLNLFDGSCDISTITGSGNAPRSFNTTGNFETQVYKLSIALGEINPFITITTWEEIP